MIISDQNTLFHCDETDLTETSGEDILILNLQM